jgi:hypothetical protein
VVESGDDSGSVSRRTTIPPPSAKSRNRTSRMSLRNARDPGTVHASWRRTPAPGSDGTQYVMTVRSVSAGTPTIATHRSGLFRDSEGRRAPHTAVQSWSSTVARTVIGVTAPSLRSTKKGDLVRTCGWFFFWWVGWLECEMKAPLTQKTRMVMVPVWRKDERGAWQTMYWDVDERMSAHMRRKYDAASIHNITENMDRCLEAMKGKETHRIGLHDNGGVRVGGLKGLDFGPAPAPADGGVGAGAPVVDGLGDDGDDVGVVLEVGAKVLGGVGLGADADEVVEGGSQVLRRRVLVVEKRLEGVPEPGNGVVDD